MFEKNFIIRWFTDPDKWWNGQTEDTGPDGYLSDPQNFKIRELENKVYKLEKLLKGKED